MSTKIEGTSGVQFPDASVQSSAVGSSAFSAFILGVAVSGGATDSALAPTQINFNEGGEYNPTTGRFTCTRAGLYQFNATVGVVLGAAPTFVGFYGVLLKNGVYWLYGSGFNDDPLVGAVSTVSALIYLQPGDYVQCAVTGQFGAGCTLGVYEFSGFFVRSMP